jgi:hypothetical protein
LFSPSTGFHQAQNNSSRASDWKSANDDCRTLATSRRVALSTTEKLLPTLVSNFIDRSKGRFTPRHYTARGLGRPMVSKFFRTGNTARRNGPALSIRARLVVLALLVVVPLMVDRVRVLEATRAERIESAVDDVLDLARRGVEGQREIVTTARALLQVVARAYVSTSAPGDPCGHYLSDLTANIPWIRATGILNERGRAICSTNPKAVGIDLSDRDYCARSSWLRSTCAGSPRLPARSPAGRARPCC